MNKWTTNRPTKDGLYWVITNNEYLNRDSISLVDVFFNTYDTQVWFISPRIPGWVDIEDIPNNSMWYTNPVAVPKKP